MRLFGHRIKDVGVLLEDVPPSVAMRLDAERQRVRFRLGEKKGS